MAHEAFLGVGMSFISESIQFMDMDCRMKQFELLHHMCMYAIPEAMVIRKMSIRALATPTHHVICL
jgi:hypothetical protein